jgi:ribonucleoside-triphosphate reductase (thioredoxin)
MTVYVGKDEWLRVGSWVWDNWDIVSGISFLPKEDEEHVYQLAPYEEINKEKYDELMTEFPEIDFGKLIQYEMEDTTQGAQSYACVSGACEIDLSPEEKTRILASIKEKKEANGVDFLG